MRIIHCHWKLRLAHLALAPLALLVILLLPVMFFFAIKDGEWSLALLMVGAVTVVVLWKGHLFKRKR